MPRFCFLCGKVEREEEPLIDNLCWSCYKAEHPLILVPSNLRVSVCVSCGSFKLGRRWIRPPIGADPHLFAAEEFVRRSVKLNGSGSFEVSKGVYLDDASISVHVKASGSVHPLIPEYVEERQVHVSIENVTCPTCLKSSSGKFESKIQLRADGRALDRHEVDFVLALLNSMMKIELSGDQNAFAYEFEEVHGGVNFKFTSYRLARLFSGKLREKFGAFLKESFKVVGVDRSSGTRISRLTISVRLPRFRSGDLILFNGRVLRYDLFRGNRFRCLDLERWEESYVPYNDVWSGRVKFLAGGGELYEGMVVSVYDDVVQVMDSSSYELFEAFRPVNSVFSNGALVKYFIFDGKVFLVALK